MQSSHPHYIVTAGPQAAGKSTLVRDLCARDPGLTPLEEARQIVVHKYQRKGAIFMTVEDELEVIHIDTMRMASIVDGDRAGARFVDETNVFTLAHARAHGVDWTPSHFNVYRDALARLNAVVLFLDVPPEVSWERRHHRYLQRLWDASDAERDETMARYKAYLFRLYRELSVIYDELDCPKARIDASAHPEATLESAVLALTGMST